jgi:hypothetical protein
MSRLPLAQVTLCAVDTRTPALAAQGLLRSMHQIDFGRVFLFTYDWLPNVVLPGIEIVEIEPLRNAVEYARFVMRQLPAYIRTSHALLTHWDGFVVNPAAWNDEFLVYDYVGATGLDEPDKRVSFHGPMSLRSRRFLLSGMDPRIPDGHPEDLVLCQQQRAFLESTHGVFFAPEALARRFVETDGVPAENQLGFQGVAHLARLLPDTEMSRWLDEPGSDFFASAAGRTLLLALVTEGKTAAAAKLLDRRRQAGCEDSDVTLLSTAARVMGALRSPAR